MRCLIVCLLLPTVLHASRGDGLRGLDHAAHADDLLLPFEQFIKTGKLPTDLMDLMPGLQGCGLLADMSRFNPMEQAESSSVFQKLADALRQRGASDTAPLATALEPHKSRFGTALLLGVLTPFAPDLLLTLKPSVGDFAKLPAARRAQVLRAMKLVWPDVAARLRQSSDSALKPYLAALHVTAQAKLDALLAQQSTDSLGTSHTAWEDQIVESTVELLACDVGMAAQCLQHAAHVIDETQQAGTWKGRSYANGFNVASALLESVCRKTTGAAAFQAIALSAHLCSEPAQQTFLYPAPVEVTALHEFFLSSQGLADPRGATRTLLTELNQCLGTAPPETLIFVFHAWAEKLPRWHEAIVRDEAARLAKGKADIAQALVTALGLHGKEVTSLKRVRGLIHDEPKLNPLLRAQFAALLCEATGDALEADDLRCGMMAGIQLLEEKLPASGAIWEKLLPAFNRSPKTPAWDALAKNFRQSWLHCARFQKLGNLPAWQRFNLTPTTALHALETFARSGHEPDLVSFADNYRVAYRSLTSARLILARHRCTAELQQVMAYANGVAGIQDDTTGIAFRRDDEASFDWLTDALPDKAQRTLARVQIAQVRDSQWQPSTVRREQRLTVEARQWSPMEMSLPVAAQKHAEDLLLESLPAAQAVVDSWLKTHLIEDEWQAALPANGAAFQRARMIRRPLMLALAALANGDGQPWQRSLAWLRNQLADSKEAPGLLKDLSYRVAAICMSSLREQGASAAWVPLALSDVIALKPESAPLTVVEEVVQVRLGCTIISGGVSSEVANTLRPLWLVYVLNVTALDQATSGIVLLLRALRDPLARQVLSTADDLSYQGKMPAHWPNALLREHTTELLNADPGNPAVLLSLLNAWTDTAERKPLLEALRVIQPKLDPVRDAKALAYIASVEHEAK